MTVSSIITTIVTSLGQTLGSVLANLFSAIAGFFRFLHEEREDRKEKKKEEAKEKAKEKLEDAIDNGDLSQLLDATIEDKNIRAKINELIRLKKSGKEHDMLSVENSLVDYARNLADYYNDKIGSFRPELNASSADALDSILYDMVKANA